MAKSLTISTERKDFSEQLEFQQLRTVGIEHISTLAGDIWTDHNLHDPGVTILEVLCYALTDLVYRQNLDIEELLAKPDNESPQDDNFFTASKILTCNPLTILDYRKMLIDIDGVRNAWLEIATKSEEDIIVDCNKNTLQAKDPKKETENKLILNGLYNVYLELDTIRPQDKTTDACGEVHIPTGRILNEVRRRLHEHRNLCEDFFEIIVLQEDQIGLCSDLELEPGADPEEVLIDLFKNVQDFLSPNVPFYTLRELLDKGKSPMEAFAGRPHLLNKDEELDSHGFIDVDELEELSRKTEIYVSDLYQVILKDERIRAIKSLVVLNYRDGVPLSKGEEWCLKITDRHRPILAPELCRIKTFKGLIPFSVNIKNIRERYEERLVDYGKVKLGKEALDLPIPYGQYRDDLGGYYSIQTDFPQTYMVGKEEVPGNATPLRKAQAKQLKGYLMFFDQLLADYLSQLTHVRDLFSMERDKKRSVEKSHTVFPGILKTVPHQEELISFYNNKNTDLKAIASHPVRYKSPAEREEGLRKTLLAFQQTDIEKNIFTEERNGAYYYLLKDNAEQTLLESVDKFSSVTKAKEAAEDILVLVGQKQGYRMLNFPTKEEYGFEFFYSPVHYFDFVRKIAESSTDYYRKRNRFLDHLLGRFGEHFTDYVLLMYALNGKSNDQETIIDDKADFLYNYPDISRNRGRGFDYTKPDQSWNTNNVTGIENKVAKLLGLKESKRANFNNFCVVRRDQQYYFQYLDHRGNVLLRSRHGFDTLLGADTSINAFLHLVQQSQEGWEVEDVNCLTEQAYTFKVNTKDAELSTYHPYTYAGEKETKAALKSEEPIIYSKTRLAKKSFVVDLIKGNGLVSKINPLHNGFYFWILNEEKLVLLVSSRPYETEEQAWDAWLQLIDLAVSPDNYRMTEDPLKKGFGYEVGYTENGTFFPLAKNPNSFKTKPVRTTAKKYTLNYLQSKKLKWTIEQSPSVYSWEIRNSAGILLLNSVPAFKTTHQTTAAYYYLIKIAGTEENYFLREKEVDGKTSYGFVIGERGQYEDTTEDGKAITKDWWVDLAKCPVYFDNPEERDTHLAKVKHHLQKHNNYEDIIAIDHAAWAFELMDDEGTTLLKSVNIFPNRKEAQYAWESFLSLALLRKNYHFVREEGFLQVGVVLKNPNKVTIARLPKGIVFENEEAAEQFIQKIIAFTKTGSAVFADRLSEAFFVTIKIPQSSETINGLKFFNTRIEALHEYIELVKAAADPKNYTKKGNIKEQYAFEIETGSGHKVGRSEMFSTAAQRDIALQNTCDYFLTAIPKFNILTHEGKYRFDIFDGKENVGLSSSDSFETSIATKKRFYETTKLASVKKYYDHIKSEDACTFSFLLKDKNKAEIAFHPEYYLSKKERHQAKIDFIKHIKENSFHFEIAEKSGTFFFEILWENCSGNCEVLWKDTAEYNIEEKAKSALSGFKEALNKLNKEELLKKIEINEDDKTWSFYLTIKMGKGLPDYIVVHPRSYPDKKRCKEVVEDAVAYLTFAREKAAKMPISKTDIEFRKNYLELIVKHPLMLSENFKGNDTNILSVVPTIDYRYYLNITKEPFYFEILWKTGEVLLRSATAYSSKEEANVAFISFWKSLVTNRNIDDGSSIIQLVKDEQQKDNKWSFRLIVTSEDNTEYMLVHPLSYPDEKSCNDVVADTQSYLDFAVEFSEKMPIPEEDIEFRKNYLELIVKHPLMLSKNVKGNDTNILPVVHKIDYHYYLNITKEPFFFEILWKNNDVLLRSATAYSSKEEANAVFICFWESLVTNRNIDDGISIIHLVKEEQQEGNKWSFRMSITSEDNTEYILIHPKSYPNKGSCTNAVKDVKSYLVFAVEFYEKMSLFKNNEKTLNHLLGNWKEHALITSNNIVPKNTQVAPFAISKESGFGFRLTAGTESIAVHPFTYRKQKDRNDVVKLLLKKPVYSTLKMNGVTGKTTTGFYYVLIEPGDKAVKLWQSSVTYFSRKEAAEVFNTTYLELIERSKMANAYQITKVAEGFQLELVDDENNILAIVPGCFSKKSEAQTAGQYRRKWASRFPIVKKQNYYGFQIYNLATQKIDWQSKKLFLTDREALDAFRHFLQHQSYEGNYRFIDKPDPCIFEVELGETLLESARSFVDKNAAWKGEGLRECHGLNTFLRAVQEEGALYPFFDPHAGCRFGFRAVDTSYVLLRHPREYLTADKREAARDQLFAQYQCGKIDCSEVSFGYKCILLNYHGLLKFDKETLWRSFEKFTNKEQAKAHIETIYMDVVTAAREFDYYVSVKVDNRIELHLTDDSNNVLVVSSKTYADQESANKTIAKRILAARQYPYAKKDDGISIQLYSVPNYETPKPTTEDQNHCPPHGNIEVTVPGKVVWESVKIYPTIQQGDCDLKIIKELLSDKENYERPDRDDCGPFTVELTNPKKSLAYHPARYINRSDLQEAMDKTMQHINREGFHLVEHILLRPRQGTKGATDRILTKIPLCLEKEICESIELKHYEEEQDIMDNYLPGADPFSFWVSIVIPFWSKRFQSENFRAFFEDTLRRELPAHIAMRICWVSPKNLKEFEFKYNNWLTALSGTGACNFQQAQSDLVEQLFLKMHNVYDPAVLHGCEEDSSGIDVYLDQTKLG